jgi:hypothetical protein
LQLLAEIGVAFVGFSMLASVFRSSEGEDRVRYGDFRNVAETGLLATFGSLAPLFLNALGWQDEAAWRWASGGLAALWATGAIAATRRLVREEASHNRTKTRPVRIGLLHFVSATIVVLGLSNALFPSSSSGGRHVLLVGICLAQSAQLFLLAGFEGAGGPAGSSDDGAG